MYQILLLQILDNFEMAIEWSDQNSSSKKGVRSKNIPLVKDVLHH